MGKKLVIVESPTKVRTISRILGDEYTVASSIGHIRDLPLKKLGVDIDNDFKPQYVVLKGKQKVIDDLKKKTASSDVIYLAPDPDREGEAIAWHLKAVLEPGNENKSFFRVQYNEITNNAVKHALANPRDIDMNRVDAQQARRILDRIVGYQVSPVLWQRIKRGLSAGRVQSVALRLVCEREAEIRSFIPEAYWLVGAIVRKRVEPLDPFSIRLSRINGEKADIKNGEQAESIIKELNDCSMRILGIALKETTRRAPPPHITSTLQQAGSTYHGFSPKRTMDIAQKLYEGLSISGEHVGLITYMRTDSFSVSAEALGSCRQLIKEQFGAEYCPDAPNFYKSKAGSQGAHEAIRPTDVYRTPESLKNWLVGPELKLYELIWRRFVASQMVPARIEQKKVDIEAQTKAGAASNYLFNASASEVIFPGYMKVAGTEMRTKDDQDESEKLPPLSEGEYLDRLEWTNERKETQPPGRYSEASLIKALESNGVGRPSTYAQIITTLHYRNYVIREKKSLSPTDLGMQVNALLVSMLGQLFDVKFTATMEESLDRIEEGSVNYTKMLSDFYETFKVWMEATKLPPADEKIVSRVLSVLKGVKEWAPEVKRGKKTYSDHKFMESVEKQLTGKTKPVSQRQLMTLIRMGLRYKEQISDSVEKIIRESGMESIFNEPELQPPSESTIRKLEILQDISMDESGRTFLDSLKSRVESGRRLSEAQVQALDNIVVAHSKKIENFDAKKEILEIKDDMITLGKQCKPLLDAMSFVNTWAEPVTRGKMVFNDKSFYESLSQYFEKKGFLSVKQIAALKRMVRKYRDQIPSYELVAQECDIKAVKKRGSTDG